ncbi:hypothetical protein BV372_14095 [Nostoc sp. T09]|nr:hypothetical protein BV372_14095 [Nostoc sp. T09]
MSIPKQSGLFSYNECYRIKRNLSNCSLYSFENKVLGMVGDRQFQSLIEILINCNFSNRNFSDRP